MKQFLSVTRRVLLSSGTALVLGAGVAGGAAFAQTATDQVKIATSMGDIVLELYGDKAPKTVENFLAYAKSGHYDNTVFHRVMDGFMIQGGGYTADMKQKETKPPIVLEANNGLKNDRGTIAMARTGVPNSATSQFFINVVNNDGLNAPRPDGHGYAVFGKVTAGMEVVDKIKAVPVGNVAGMQNVPKTAVVIKSVTILQK